VPVAELRRRPGYGEVARERGLLTPDPLLLGLASTPEGELLDEEGRVVPGLYAVGPPRKGTLHESTAIPEIRTQAAQVAGLVLARPASPASRTGVVRAHCACLLDGPARQPARRSGDCGTRLLD